MPVSSTLSSPATSGTFTFTVDGGHKINGGQGGANKVIMLEANGIFGNHFKQFEEKHRVRNFKMFYYTIMFYMAEGSQTHYMAIPQIIPLSQPDTIPQCKI